MATVERTSTDGVSTVALQRPDDGNALDASVLDELSAAVRETKRSDDRCLLLLGTGADFCAGAPWERLGDSAAALHQRQREVFTALLELEVPVVAGLHGRVNGTGLALALTADLRVATPNTRLSVENGDGRPAFGVATMLYRAVPRSTATALLLARRELGVEEGQQCSLVHHVTVGEDVSPTAVEQAKALAAAGADWLLALKRATALLPVLDLSASFDYELHLSEVPNDE